jgi:hypothetical protein
MEALSVDSIPVGEANRNGTDFVVTSISVRLALDQERRLSEVASRFSEVASR